MTAERKPIVIPDGYKLGATEARILIKYSEIISEILFLSRDIYSDYREGRDPILIGLSNGATPFTDRLGFALERRGLHGLRSDYLPVSRYGDTTRPNDEVKIGDLKLDITGQHIIVAEDVYDQGITLKKVDDFLRAEEPASIEYTMLAIKEGALKTSPIHIKYPVFVTQGDPWLQGFGIDTEERGRYGRDIVARDDKKTELLLGGPDGI